MIVQWYPGHMAKARRAMQNDIRLVDLVIEILDARIPLSSENPDIDTLASGKMRLVLLNKADLADPGITRSWQTYFLSKGIASEALDSRNGNIRRAVLPAILKTAEAKFEKDRKKGIQNRPLRAMIAGIPNVGKSTFINSFAGRSSMKTGNKPGVTKTNQWLKLDKQVELLDTPGLLWPRFDDETTGLHLAYIGSVNDDIIDSGELCYHMLKTLKCAAPECLKNRYGIDFSEDPNDTVREIALARKALKKGGEPDTEKAAKMIIDDFRTGKLGRISLEMPDLS